MFIIMSIKFINVIEWNIDKMILNDVIMGKTANVKTRSLLLIEWIEMFGQCQEFGNCLSTLSQLIAKKFARCASEIDICQLLRLSTVHRRYIFNTQHIQYYTCTCTLHFNTKLSPSIVANCKSQVAKIRKPFCYDRGLYLSGIERRERISLRVNK